MQRDEASHALLSILDGFGISVVNIDGWDHTGRELHRDVRLRRHNSSQLYMVFSALDELDGVATSLASRPNTAPGELDDRRLLIVAERLNARTMTAYRNRDIDYADQAGNALIRFGDVYIDVRGRSAKRAEMRNETRHAPVNIFSARRSQVIFALIVWPELFTLPIKYTSEAAGVSIGIAFQTTQLLRGSGYLIGDANPKLIRKSELVDRWTDAFATGLKNKLTIAKFRGERLDVVGKDAKEGWYVSGEYAVRSMLRPTTLTIYVEDLEPALIAANRWRRDDHPNIEVRKKFWKDPRQILQDDRSNEFNGIDPEVPALLIYADLMASGDGRQREIAQSFRETHHELIGD